MNDACVLSCVVNNHRNSVFNNYCNLSFSDGPVFKNTGRLNHYISVRNKRNECTVFTHVQ